VQEKLEKLNELYAEFCERKESNRYSTLLDTVLLKKSQEKLEELSELPEEKISLIKIPFNVQSNLKKNLNLISIDNIYILKNFNKFIGLSFLNNLPEITYDSYIVPKLNLNVLKMLRLLEVDFRVVLPNISMFIKRFSFFNRCIYIVGQFLNLMLK
jgi:GDP-D-mannose dehydratase